MSTSTSRNDASIQPHRQPPPSIRACLFDMDGLLIDSEDIYTICTNDVLHQYGRPSLPWHIKAQLQGRPGPQAGAIFEQWAQLPVSRDVYMQRVSELQKELFPNCKALPGVEDLLRTLAEAKTEGSEGEKIEMALATSSHAGNFKVKTGHLEDLFKVFKQENRVLGDDKRIPPGRGKPAPDIYLLALRTINERLERDGKEAIRPEQCLVFEDSVPGVEAGRRAGMQAVWCPHPGLLEEMKGKEELVLAGMMGQHKEVEEEKDGAVDRDEQGRKKGAPGEVGDGWARLYATLEDFPYASYGIEVKR